MHVLMDYRFRNLLELQRAIHAAVDLAGARGASIEEITVIVIPYDDHQEHRDNLVSLVSEFVNSGYGLIIRS